MHLFHFIPRIFLLLIIEVLACQVNKDAWKSRRHPLAWSLFQPKIEQTISQCTPEAFSHLYLLFALHIHDPLYMFHEHLHLRLICFNRLWLLSPRFSNRKLSSCREEVSVVLEVPVLFCRAWLYSPPGTPALCLCNRGAPASPACLWRRGEGGCRSASGSRRRGGAWPSEEFPSTPGAPLWTHARVRHRKRENER